MRTPALQREVVLRGKSALAQRAPSPKGEYRIQYSCPVNRNVSRSAEICAAQKFRPVSQMHGNTEGYALVFLSPNCHGFCASRSWFTTFSGRKSFSTDGARAILSRHVLSSLLRSALSPFCC